MKRRKKSLWKKILFSKFGREPIPSDVRKKVLKRANNCCQIDCCDEKDVLDIHHIDNENSNNKIENLVVLCPTHHRKVHKGILKLDGDISKKSDVEKVVDFIEDTINLFKPNKKRKRKKDIWGW